jgi:hypothetical protein
MFPPHWPDRSTGIFLQDSERMNVVLFFDMSNHSRYILDPMVFLCRPSSYAKPPMMI